MALTRIGLNQSINLASNVTGTLPTGNGGTGATSFAPGKVLQVITNDHATRFVTSSTSYVAATGYTVVITPSATSSKIFLINSGGGGDIEASGRILYGTYYRTISGGSATDIVGDAEGISQIYNAGDRTQAPLNMSMLDSPSTTSEVTYQIYIKSNSGQVSYNNNEGKAQFTAFEIAG
jgi:hypothetical protein